MSIVSFIPSVHFLIILVLFLSNLGDDLFHTLRVFVYFFYPAPEFFVLLGPIMLLIFYQSSARQFNWDFWVLMHRDLFGLLIFLSFAVASSYISDYGDIWMLTSTVIDFFPFLDELGASWSFVFDPVSSLMVSVVMWISFAVQIFAYNYMFTDKNRAEFVGWLILFTACMILFVCSENLFVLLCGWEALGVCSFALIGFWHTRPAAVKAALKAITFNRVGDCALILALCLLVSQYQTLSIFDLSVLFGYAGQTIIPGLAFSYEQVIAFLFIIAAAAKSAQIGFHVWLSDAMEGPTPVSALLHAATMVTAGVYLLIRMFFVLELSYSAQVFCFFIGLASAIFGSLMALTQDDLKRVIAFSTCSQLGYMFLACAAGAPLIAFFHLLTHAFFKALLFICAGYIIHSLGGEQDLRKMGGMFWVHPLICAAMLLASLSLAGFPFFSGFYSKDAILAVLLGTGTALGQLAWIGALFAACLTAIYSANSIYLVFFGQPRWTFSKLGSLQASSYLFEGDWFVLLILLFPSLAAGRFFKRYCYFFWTDSVGYNSDLFTSGGLALEFIEWLPVEFKLAGLVPTCLFIIFLVLNGYIRWAGFKLFEQLRVLYSFIRNRFYFENIYYFFIAVPFSFYSYFVTFKEMERFVMESLAVRMPYIGIRRLAMFVAAYELISTYRYLSFILFIFLPGFEMFSFVVHALF